MSQIDRYFERYGPAYKWWATGTIMIATISVVLSTTIVNVAIPAVMGAFGISAVQAQWISTGFLAAMTATMLLADWANRAFGMRLTMNAAMGIWHRQVIGVRGDESPAPGLKQPSAHA
ncbi:MAG: hypothetical protein ACU0BN_10695 [Sulfitobacter sp.]|uniref:hypothetical protein n=1 Tax=Sulfitobacter sp. TaxID=1903071 RepID=UPI004057FECC|tara:strand:- start:3330 stop:3683 length:354 start_codon:yes stop_codon:yes gene_type:complete